MPFEKWSKFGFRIKVFTKEEELLIEVNYCPYCGEELKVATENEFVAKQCIKCNNIYITEERR